MSDGQSYSPAHGWMSSGKVETKVSRGFVNPKSPLHEARKQTAYYRSDARSEAQAQAMAKQYREIAAQMEAASPREHDGSASQVGARGGRYHLSDSGQKVYEKK